MNLNKGEIKMSYKVIKQMWTPDGMECEHALCDPLHKPYHKHWGQYPFWYCDKPAAERTEWIIVDTATGEPLLISGELRYDLKRDAVNALKYHNK